MEEPGSQNNVDSSSFTKMNRLTYRHIKRSILFLKNIFKEKLGKHHG